MRRIGVVALGVALLVVAPAGAIVFGQPDEGRHPNVGAMMVQPAGAPAAFPVCSGTLIEAEVFLTAAHCIAATAEFFGDDADVFVSFADDLADPADPAAALIPVTDMHMHPSYSQSGRSGKSVDVGVLSLEESPTGVEPAALPEEGLVDDLDLKQASFTTVGYGAVRDDKTKGPHSLFGDTIRRMATQGAQSRNAAWLLLSMNPSTGNGGTCYGDSGGPHFLGETDIVVSLTVTGDRYCRATDWTARVDTETVLDFLAEFIDD
jgi:secreted trypsin-like serine protease